MMRSVHSPQQAFLQLTAGVSVLGAYHRQELSALPRGVRLSTSITVTTLTFLVLFFTAQWLFKITRRLKAWAAVQTPEPKD
jgi:hypothetical protein